MNMKMTGVLVLGLVLVATVAALYVLPTSAVMNGDTDQIRDKDRDRIQDKDCSCDCLRDQIRTQTRLQTRDC
jgi:hypothetical protein